MRKLSVLLILVITANILKGQTNPTVLSLPVSIDFGTTSFTPPFANTAAWTTGSLSGSLAAAESSIPTGDITGSSATPVSGSAGTQYGHAVSGNGRLTIHTSGNATNGSTQAVVAINTSSLTGITISYDAVLTVPNLRDVGLALQYRIGTTGSFTTITGTAATYNSGTSNAGDADGNTDYDNFSVSLPAAAEGQPVVQLRWITWRGAQAGNSSGIGIDNINIFSGAGIPVCAEPATQPALLNLSVTPTTVTGNFSASVPAPDEYIIIRSVSSSLSATPADGNVYVAGQSIGGGTVVVNTSATSFTDAGLNPSTQYYYFIFAMNNEDCTGGPNYLIGSPLTGNITTSALPSCTPPSAPTGLSLTPSNAFITGSFTASGSANRYLVVISTNSTLSATPANGVVYTQGQSFGGGTVLSYSSATTLTASGLNPATLYYIFVFAANGECTGEPFYNTAALSGSKTTTNTSTGIPSGYYNSAAGLTCQPLKTALRNITASGHNPLSYSGVWTAYQYTDIHRNDANTANIIWDIYTDDPNGPETFMFTYSSDQCGNYNSEGDCYNREHTTPASWFNDAAPMYTDVHQLYPTDGWVNNKRGNFPFGEVSNATFTSIDNQSRLGTGNNYGYTGTVFEPNDAFKGDVARTALYMATRYENEIISQNWAGNSEAAATMLSSTDEPDAAKRRLQIYETWFIRTLFDWMSADPVSQKEIDRNNAIYYQSGQQNRNPFVDHPEYAAAIWQCSGVVPVTIIDFIATKKTNSVYLKWYATFETSFRKFEVERSTDGISFTTIGSVEGRNLANYGFQDNSLPNSPVLYYRLKLVDVDGQFKYSKIATVRLSRDFSNAYVYPNPAKGFLNIRLTEALTEKSMIKVTDITGRTLSISNAAGGSYNIRMSTGELTPGRYIVTISNSTQVFNQSFVVIQ